MRPLRLQGRALADVKDGRSVATRLEKIARAQIGYETRICLTEAVRRLRQLADEIEQAQRPISRAAPEK